MCYDSRPCVWHLSGVSLIHWINGIFPRTVAERLQLRRLFSWSQQKLLACHHRHRQHRHPKLPVRLHLSVEERIKCLITKQMRLDCQTIALSLSLSLPL